MSRLGTCLLLRACRAAKQLPTSVACAGLGARLTGTAQGPLSNVCEGATVSDDNHVAKELVETLKDGERGFASAAEKLRDGDHAQWATTLQRLSEQRAGFRREIVE